ncbi:MAG: hypothetical protein HZB56_10230 [Deltaproteobacteria bacterium]|nr:hypothetical protein [Deltaproteobacteria bacterium]
MATSRWTRALGAGGWLLAIVALLGAPPAGAAVPARSKVLTAAPAPACAPPCREGFTCVQGRCLSACNPPCDARERCTADGRCLAAEPAAAPAPIAPAVPAPPAPPPSEQAPASAPSWELGVAAGVLLPGEISTDSATLETSAGLLLRASADFHLGPRFSLGPYALYASTTVGASDGHVIALGAALKGIFALGQSASLRPGVALAYQLSRVQSGSDSAAGLGVAALLELAVPFSRGANGFLHLSFLSQPAGGISGVTDVTWAPIIYLALGVELVR